MRLCRVEDQAASGLEPTREGSMSHASVMDSPLRVLMITEASGGGAGRHVLDLSEGLLARGCDVHLIYSPCRIDRFFPEHLDRIDSLNHATCPLHRSIHPGDF